MDNRVAKVNKLLKQIQNGEEKALTKFYDEFSPLFIYVAKKYLFDPNYVEDIISELFVDLVERKARSFNEKFNGLNWIFTIIRNKAYKYNAKYSTERTTNWDDIKNLKEFIVCSTDENTDKLDLIRALEMLSDYENELLYYMYWECLTIREIAQKLNIPKSNVHYDLKKALIKIKKILENI